MRSLSYLMGTTVTACLSLLSVAGARQSAVEWIAPSLAAQERPVELALPQPASSRLAFDVASVKLDRSSQPPRSNFPLGIYSSTKPVGPRFSVTNMSLRALLTFAYKLTGNITYLMPGLPGWIDTERFDIDARAAGNPTKDQFRLMVQWLLADRFKLSLHHETRRIPVFALVLAQPGKLGPQLMRHTDDRLCVDFSSDEQVYASPSGSPLPPLPCGTLSTLQSSVPGQVRTGARGVSLQSLASSLVGAEDFERPLVDRTGLTGTFDLWFQWTAQAFHSDGTPVTELQRDPDGPSLKQAVQEQLGLKLVSETLPVDVLVVDRLERPIPN